MARFERYVGIDYSGAETPEASLSALRLYVAEAVGPAREVGPPASPRWYWSRRELAEWLAERLREDRATLVGIHHGFSFPAKYFLKYRLAWDWGAFLEDFVRYWPTGEPHTYVDFVIDGLRGNGAARSGRPAWRRLTESRAGKGAGSVFQFSGKGAMGKPTHAGLPWLLWLRRQVGARAHFWPFDGWEMAEGASAVVEARPGFWGRGLHRERRSASQQDAWVIAESLRRADRDGSMEQWWRPGLDEGERRQAEIEGWIFGVR